MKTDKKDVLGPVNSYQLVTPRNPEFTAITEQYRARFLREENQILVGDKTEMLRQIADKKVEVPPGRNQYSETLSIVHETNEFPRGRASGVSRGNLLCVAALADSATVVSGSIGRGGNADDSDDNGEDDDETVS